MSLESGVKLGPYQIVAPISTGNGGDIYKASDTRLNRIVSIRLLPEEFAANSEVRQRLERDVKAIASLNHPNICGLYDVGDQNGANYLVTEHVEGETLAQRLTRGPMELDEALKVGIAVADALDKAHRTRVTHRSLNPSNVMITAAGAKLMNFGLAKPEPLQATAVSISAISTRMAAKTVGGVSAEAAPYMAPEQWDGVEGDARSDIFALGAILYEMITGAPAFEGKSQAMLVAAIQTIDPEPVSARQPLAPPALDYLINRCLAKDPKKRLQTAWDLLSQLQWIAEGGSQVGVPAVFAAKRKKQERLIWIGMAVAALLVIAMAPATYHYLKGATEQEGARFVLTNMGNGQGAPPSISPDGRWVFRSTGALGLVSVHLASVMPQVIAKDNTETQPFWSPDSKFIAFYEDGKLKTVPVSGGLAKTICETPPPVTMGTWNENHDILYSSAGLIYRVLDAGGQPTAVTKLDASRNESAHLMPVFLPDNRHFLYLATAAQPVDNAIYVGDMEGKDKPKKLFASTSKALYAAPGYILFNKESTIFAQSLNLKTFSPEGEPVRVAEGVQFMVSGSQGGATTANLDQTASYAVSQTGVLTYRIGNNSSSPAPTTNAVGDRTLTWIDHAGVRTGQVGGPGAYAGIDLTANGKKVAVHVHETNGGGDSWFFDSDQGRMQRLTFDSTQNNSSPVWSSDGTRFAYASKRGSKWGIYVKLADNTAKEELITESDTLKSPMSWTPDGKTIVYWTVGQQTGGDIWYVPVGDKKPVAFLQTTANERHPQLSPDGKWLAYESNETGRPEIYIKPFPEGPGRWQISTDGGSVPRWRGDSRELYFLSPPNMISVEIIVSGTSIVARAPKTMFALTSNPGPTILPSDYMFYAVSPDGKRFLIPQLGGPTPTGTGTGSLAQVLANAADQGGTAATSFNSLMVVVNWPRLMNRK
jgi:Tol biopolymer transport system component